MADNQNPKNSPPSPSSSSDSRVPTEPNHNGKHHYPNPPGNTVQKKKKNPPEIGYNGSSSINGHKHHHYPNPPDPINPDAATLREQWRYATRQYSRWYSQAWGSAILAGMAFFALGWIVKGSNPLPSFGNNNNNNNGDETKKLAQEQKPQQQEEEGHDVPCPPVPATLTSNPCDAVHTPKS